MRKPRAMFQAGIVLAAATVFALAPASASATVTGSSTITPGSGNTLSDAITYTADSGEQAQSVTDVFPAGTTINQISASGTGGQNDMNTTCYSPSPNKATCLFSSAPFSAGQTLTLTVTTASPVSPGSTVQLSIVDQNNKTWGPFTQSWAASSGGGGGGGGGGGSGGGGSSGGGGGSNTDLVVVSIDYPVQVTVGAAFVFTVTVTNQGTIASKRNRLTVLEPTGSPAAHGYFLEGLTPGGNRTTVYGQHGGQLAVEWTIEPLQPDGSAEFVVRAVPVFGSPFHPDVGTGPYDLSAQIEPDSDGPDAGDSANAVTEIVFAGRAIGKRVCSLGKAGDRAAAAAASCPASRVTGFSGTASGHVTSVQIAIERLGKGAHAARATRRGCSELVAASGRFRRVRATRGRCTHLDWLKAHGTRHWSFALRRPLPPGHYVLYARPVTPLGVPVTGPSISAQQFVLR